MSVIDLVQCGVFVIATLLPQASSGGGSGHTFVQSPASALWTVNHNLGYNPIVEVSDSGGTVVWANIVHTSVNQFTVTFDTPTAGSLRYI
jgi:hypothetical protein